MRITGFKMRIIGFQMRITGFIAKLRVIYFTKQIKIN